MKRVIAVAAACLAAVIALSACGSTKIKDVAGPTVVKTATVTATATQTLPAKVVHVTTTPVVKKVDVIATHTATVTYTPAPKHAFGDGQYLINKEILPGMYHTNPNGGQCYYELLFGLGGGLDDIITNDNIDGPTTIQIDPSVVAIETNGGCDWTVAQ
jgi:hypothetical protein